MHGPLNVKFAFTIAYKWDTLTWISDDALTYLLTYLLHGAESFLRS